MVAIEIVLCVVLFIFLGFWIEFENKTSRWCWWSVCIIVVLLVATTGIMVRVLGKRNVSHQGAKSISTLKNPIIWGQGTWKLLHCISFHYDPARKKDYKSFFVSLGKVLPCDLCKDHYSEFSSIHPVESALASKADLIRWVIDLHNYANQYSEGSSPTRGRKLSYGEAMTEIQSWCAA